jgi:hypothetical protein
MSSIVNAVPNISNTQEIMSQDSQSKTGRLNGFKVSTIVVSSSAAVLAATAAVVAAIFSMHLLLIAAAVAAAIFVTIAILASRIQTGSNLEKNDKEKTQEIAKKQIVTENEVQAEILTLEQIVKKENKKAIEIPSGSALAVTPANKAEAHEVATSALTLPTVKIEEKAKESILEAQNQMTPQEESEDDLNAQEAILEVCLKGEELTKEQEKVLFEAYGIDDDLLDIIMKALKTSLEEDDEIPSQDQIPTNGIDLNIPPPPPLKKSEKLLQLCEEQAKEFSLSDDVSLDKVVKRVDKSQPKSTTDKASLLSEIQGGFNLKKADKSKETETKEEDHLDAIKKGSFSLKKATPNEGPKKNINPLALLLSKRFDAMSGDKQIVPNVSAGSTSATADADNDDDWDD